MDTVARTQFVHRAKPVLIGRTLRTASIRPEFMRQRFDLVMPKCNHAVSHRPGLRVPIGRAEMLRVQPRLLVPVQVILLPILLGDAIAMCCAVVLFGSLGVVFVMRSVVIACRHLIYSPFDPD